MGKSVLGLVFAVAAIAVPFAAPAILGLAAGSFGAIAAVTGLEVGIGLTQIVVLGSAKNPSTVQSTMPIQVTPP